MLPLWGKSREGPEPRSLVWAQLAAWQAPGAGILPNRDFRLKPTSSLSLSLSLYIYISVCTHTYIYIYLYVCIYIYIFTHMQTDLRAYAYTQFSIYLFAYLCLFIVRCACILYIHICIDSALVHIIYIHTQGN